MEMKLLIVAMTLLSAFCQPVEGGGEMYPAKTRSLVPSNSGPGIHYGRYSKATEIASLLMVLLKVNQLDVNLVFDKEKEDLARDLPRMLSKELPGMTIFQYDGSITTVKQMLKTATRKTLLLVICSGTNVLDIFRKIKENRFKSHFVDWILVMDEGGVEIIAEIEGLIFDGTKATAIVIEESDSLAFITYGAENDGSESFSYQGRWRLDDSRPDELYKFQEFIRPSHSTRMDMKGRELTIASNHAPPFIVHEDPTAQGTNVRSIAGMEHELLVALAQAINFTYREVSAPDGVWGFPQPDGTITGILGMVARREAHLGMPLIALNVHRATVVDYTHSHYQGSLLLASRAPRVKSKTLAVLTPFTSMAWACIAISVLAIGPIMKMLTEFSPQMHKEEGRLSTQVISFNMFRSLVIQGNSIISSRWSHRILLYAWFLFCLITAALYSGTLTATLAIPSYEKPINSLVELPKAVEDGFTLTVLGDTTNEYIFRDAKDGIFKEIWGLFSHENRTKSFMPKPMTALNLVMKQKNVHISPWSLIAVGAAMLGKEKFHLSRERFFPQNVGYVLPPGSSYTRSFNDVIIRLNEGGLPYKWLEDEIAKIQMSSPLIEEVTNEIAFGINHLQAAFYLILLGDTLAAMVLTMENALILVEY